MVEEALRAAFDELTRSGQDDLLKQQDRGAWPNTFRVKRLVPAVEYTMPFAMSGVDSKLYSGCGPRLSVLNRQAISSLLKFAALIWSSGE